MMEMPPDTIMDLAIILLLVPTIVYAVILNHRLSALRNSRDELAKIIGSFNEATMRAEVGIPKLKKATLDANSALQERFEKVHALRDDLAFMIERAEEIANRLDGSIKLGRATKPSQAPASSFVPMRPASQRPVLSVAQPPIPSQTLAGASNEDHDLVTGAVGTEAKVSGQREAVPAFGTVRPIGAEVLPVDGERSEAERELLKALRSKR